MLVRKFEAKSIKQAIELVKTELGPEAIILSARENEGGFGLMGQSSVEVTAAISEGKFREKREAEKKLNAKHRETYFRSSAKTQKEFIQKATHEVDGFEMAEQQPAKRMAKAPARPVTKVSYVDIPDEFVENEDYESPNPMPRPTARQGVDISASNNQEVGRLKQEIDQLKGLLDRFQRVPQNMVNMHPGAELGISYDLSFAFEKLTNAGVDKELIANILLEAEQVLPGPQKKKRAFVEGWLIRKFLEEVPVNTNPYHGRYQVFVGPTGQGKTSTVVKFAAHLVLEKKKKVAILSADSAKVGARDQLKIYCQILNIPFGQIETQVDWRELDARLKDFDHILIDTAGVNLRGGGDIDLVKNGIPSGLMHSPVIHFVQSIMVRDKDAFDIADRFKLFNFTDVIFTRLDEAVQHGLIVNFTKRYATPVMAFGTSSSVPDAFEFASKERVVDLLFQLSNSTNERGQL